MMLPRKVPSSLIQQFREKGYWLDKTLYQLLVETADRFPDKIAIDHNQTTYTFTDFKRISMHLASRLKANGITKGDIVSVQLPNCPEMMFLQVALSIIGAIINPVHLVSRKRDVYSMLNFCESKAFIFRSAFGNRNFVDEYSDIHQSAPSLRTLIALRSAEDAQLPKGIIPFDVLTAHDCGSDIVVPDTGPEDVFFLNFTSGTESEPKGFLHTFNTLLSFSQLSGSELFAFTKDDVLLTLSPMTHTFGHLITYWVVIFGAAVVLVDKYDPAETLEVMASKNVTFMQGTPAHLYGILNHENFSTYRCTSLRLVMTGGALVPKDLQLRVREQLGAEILAGYGMGETVAHTFTRIDDPDWAKLETVGRPFGGAETKIFEPAPLPEDPSITVGELGYRGPFLFIEYFKNPERTEATRDAEGWFRTGDLGYIDKSGYLHITGRKKDVINRGGTKIYPGEIENQLRFHSKIRDIAIVAMPDLVMGERSCAFVILHHTESSISLEEIQHFLEDHSVTPYKWPERVEIVSEFPMTPTGKVRKEDLRRKIETMLATSA